MDIDYQKLMRNLAARNIHASIYDTADDVVAEVQSQIPPGSTVGIGNSKTVKALRLAGTLEKNGCIIYDKTRTGDPLLAREIIHKAYLSEYYLMSSNAISLEGHIVNIDHTGNRVSALLYGPEKVIIIAGINKIAGTLEDAIHRARNHAAIKNAVRAGLHPPCVTAGHCVDCHSVDRACNSLVILEGQKEKDRISVMIVREDLGY